MVVKLNSEFLAAVVQIYPVLILSLLIEARTLSRSVYKPGGPYAKRRILGTGLLVVNEFAILLSALAEIGALGHIGEASLWAEMFPWWPPLGHVMQSIVDHLTKIMVPADLVILLLRPAFEIRLFGDPALIKDADKNEEDRDDV
jgi:uncharacterized membrane protein YccF (DUF307 family)